MTLVRSYYDEKSRTWKSAHTYGRDDLLVAAEALRQAFVWITSQGQQQSSQPSQPKEGEAPIPF